MYKNKKLRFTYKLWDFIRNNPKFKPEMEAISYLSDTKKISLDIGALNGIFIVPLLRYSSKVISFEPVSHKYEFVKNLYLNKSNVSVINVALSDFDGETEIRTPLTNDGKKLYGLSTIESLNKDKDVNYIKENVKVKKLDSLGLKNVGLVKIDVEGHEVSLLNGAIKFFNEELPNVIIESEDRHFKDAPLQVIEFFKKLNYKGYFILGRRVISINRFSIQEHQNYSKIQNEKKIEDQDYAYNFLFVSPKYQIDLPEFL